MTYVAVPAPIVHHILHFGGGREAVVGVLSPKDASGTAFLIPGWKGTDLGLRAIASALVDQGYRVVGLNLPGMGVTRTDEGRPVSMSAVAAFAEVVIDEMSKQGDCLVLGHSFGATIAAQVAVRERVKIQSLILASPIVSPLDTRQGLAGPMARGATALSTALLDQLPRTMSHALLRSQTIAFLSNFGLTTNGWKGFVRVCRNSKAESGYAADPRLAVAYLRLASEHACSEFAPNLTVASEIVAGDRDHLANVRELRQLSSTLKNSRLSLLPGGGHLAHHEASTEFSGLVAMAASRLRCRILP